MNLFALLTPLQLLIFCASVGLMASASVGWVVWVGFRHEPPGFLRRTFFDATGQPNGVLLTVFNAVIMLNALTINFIVTGSSPTPYMWATWGGIVLFGIGADTSVTRAQIDASKSGAGSADFLPGASLPGDSPVLNDSPAPTAHTPSTPDEPTSARPQS